MSIDYAVAGSPGWWMSTLVTKMALRNSKLNMLEAYLNGNAPLPEGAHGLREAYQTFQRKARLNIAELVVEAVQERMTVSGFRVGDGDMSKSCDRIWSYNELDTFSGDIHADMLGLRDGYAIVAPPNADGIATITRENPLLMIAEPDPMRPYRLRAALKLFRDEFTGFDTAYLYLPGAVYVAERRNNGPLSGDMQADMAGFDWVDGMAPMRWPSGFEDVIPVICWRNKNGVGEFERHTDTLDRINYTILQRLVIAAMQAYRQRAVKGDLPEIEMEDDGVTPKLDDDGNTIPVDLQGIMKPGPGAIWTLPTGVELWESGYTDFTPMLTAAKDDIRDLAAATRTPMHMLMPDGANQSAEGASAAREQLIFKVQDRIKRASYGWNQALALALRFQGEAVNVLDIETLWLPPEKLSLAERADAASKLIPAGVPWRTVMTDVMQFSPEKVEEMEAERLADALAVNLATPVPGEVSA